MDKKRRRYPVVPVCFRGFDGAMVLPRWAFSPFILSLYFCIQCCFLLSDLQEFYLGVESLFCLEESPLRLLEVDNVPDGVKVLPYDQQRVKRHTISNELNGIQ